METRIVVAGSGGQGILFFGKVLALAAMIEGKNVTWFPSYGAEMRGGTANCTVIISDEMIGSPVVSRADILVVLNAMSLQRFQPCLVRKGKLFYDCALISVPSLRNDISAVPVPGMTAAGKTGNTQSANMVMLGALIGNTRLLRMGSVLQAISENGSSRSSQKTRTAISSFMEGIHYIEDQKSHDC